MSRRTRLVVAFAICLAIVGGYGLLARKPEDSKARTPPPVDDEPLRLRGFDGLVLLSDARVQQELRISASQRSSIAKIANDFLEDLRPAVVAARGLQQRSKQDQVGLWSYINARRLQAARERTAEATAMLTPRQRQRLNQVAFQLRLEEVFYEPDVVQALSLTESQKRQIAEGRERLLQQARLVHQATKGRDDRDQQLAELQRLALSDYVSVLDIAQSRSYLQMRGDVVGFAKGDVTWELRQRNRIGMAK